MALQVTLSTDYLLQHLSTRPIYFSHHCTLVELLAWASEVTLFIPIFERFFLAFFVFFQTEFLGVDELILVNVGWGLTRAEIRALLSHYFVALSLLKFLDCANPALAVAVTSMMTSVLRRVFVALELHRAHKRPRAWLCDRVFSSETILDLWVGDFVTANLDYVVWLSLVVYVSDRNFQISIIPTCFVCRIQIQRLPRASELVGWV